MEKMLPSLAGIRRQTGRRKFATAHDVINEEGTASNLGKLRLEGSIYDDSQIAEEDFLGW